MSDNTTLENIVLLTSHDANSSDQVIDSFHNKKEIDSQNKENKEIHDINENKVNGEIKDIEQLPMTTETKTDTDDEKPLKLVNKNELLEGFATDIADPESSAHKQLKKSAPLFSMNKLKNATAAQREMVLRRLSSASVAELDRFEKEQGVDVLHQWLQEYQKKSDDSKLIILLQVLDRIPISIQTLKKTQIGKQCNTILREGKLSKESHDLISNLVSKWRKSVRVRMSAPIPKKKVTTENQEQTQQKKAETEISNIKQDSHQESKKRKRDVMEEIQSSGEKKLHQESSKKRVKRVSWAPPDTLEQIRVFTVDRSKIHAAFNDDQEAEETTKNQESLQWDLDGNVAQALSTNPSVIEDILNAVTENNTSSNTSTEVQSQSPVDASQGTYGYPNQMNPGWTQWNTYQQQNPMYYNMAQGQWRNMYPQYGYQQQGYQMYGQNQPQTYPNQYQYPPNQGNTWNQGQNWNGYQQY